MAEKALVRQIDYIKRTATGSVQLGVTAAVTNGVESYVLVRAVATSDTLTSLLPTWKSRIGTAVIAAAQDQFGLVVDDVAFPDFIASFVTSA